MRTGCGTCAFVVSTDLGTRERRETDKAKTGTRATFASPSTMVIAIFSPYPLLRAGTGSIPSSSLEVLSSPNAMTDCSTMRLRRYRCVASKLSSSPLAHVQKRKNEQRTRASPRGNQAPANSFHQYYLDRTNTSGLTNGDLLETRAKEETVEKARDEEESNRDEDREVLEPDDRDGDDGGRDDQHSTAISDRQCCQEGRRGAPTRQHNRMRS